MVEIWNIFKGILILLVVMTHVLYAFHGAAKPVLLEAYTYLGGFAVPLFMMLGGFFLAPKLKKMQSPEDLSAILRKLFTRVLIPYWIFAVLLLCFRAATGREIQAWQMLLLLEANTHGLYFVIVYVYSVIIFAVLGYLFRSIPNRFVYSIAIPGVSLLFYPITYMLMGVFPASTTVESLTYVSYFIFGGVINEVINAIDRKKVGRSVIFSCTVLVCFVLTGVLAASRAKFGHFPIFSKSPPTIFLFVYSLCAFIILYYSLVPGGLFHKLGKLLFFDKFGEASFFIYFVHPYFIYILPVILYKISPGIIHDNRFVVPMVVSGYIITMLSWVMLRTLPMRVQRIFSR